MCKIFFGNRALKVNGIYGTNYPLALAVRARKPHMMGLFLELGAKPDGPEYIRNSAAMQPPLDSAFKLPKCDADILLGLLRAGADPYVRSEPACTFLERGRLLR